MTQRARTVASWAAGIAATVMASLIVAAVIYSARQAHAAAEAAKAVQDMRDTVRDVPLLRRDFDGHLKWADEAKAGIDRVIASNKAHIDEKFELRTAFDKERWERQQKNDDRMLTLLEKMDTKINDLHKYMLQRAEGGATP